MSGEARGYKWPPFQPGNGVAVRHGAHSERKLRPVVDELLAALAEVAPWTQAGVFAPTVQSWAWTEARAVLYREHFDELGLADDDGQPLVGLEQWDRAERRAASLRAELGLSPASLTRLLSGLSSIDAPRAMVGLDALKAAGAGIREAIDQQALSAPPVADEVGDGDGQGDGGDEVGVGAHTHLGEVIEPGRQDQGHAPDVSRGLDEGPP